MSRNTTTALGNEVDSEFLSNYAKKIHSGVVEEFIYLLIDNSLNYDSLTVNNFVKDVIGKLKNNR